ncbi:hypothetical protein B1R27_24105 [Streptomyces sp. GKU 895]|nr:hypothetical protein B1R27_24105 [Streptomyces sp. GKU 895]
MVKARTRLSVEAEALYIRFRHHRHERQPPGRVPYDDVTGARSPPRALLVRVFHPLPSDCGAEASNG